MKRTDCTMIILFFCVSLVSIACTPSIKTPAERASGYTYVPLDPFPIKPAGDDVSSTELLDCLPDNAARVSIERINAEGNVKFGVGEASAKGDRFRITVDYINSDTIAVRLWIRKQAYLYDEDTKKPRTKDGLKALKVSQPTPTSHYLGSEIYEASIVQPAKSDGWEAYNLPVYVGVGLRVIAEVTTLKANVKVSGLTAIGGDVSAGRAHGYLIVQTLGINGEAVTAALPIQSDLNETSILNAVVSISSIKTIMRDGETIKSPRIVGIYLPFPADVAFVNAIVSALADSDGSMTWTPRCVRPASPTRDGQENRREEPPQERPRHRLERAGDRDSD